MKSENLFIDYKKLLKVTRQGQDVYKMIFPELEQIDSKKYKNICNPFYEDSNPSLSIYQGFDLKWRHKDHGDLSFEGDFIDMAASHFELDKAKSFKEILFKIVLELKLDIAELQADINYKAINTIGGYALNGEFRNDEEGLETAYTYYKNYGITKSVLKKYCVRAVKHLSVIDKNGKIRKQIFPKNQIAIAYEDVNHTKLYFPNAEKGKKFRYVGIKPKDFVFGYNQIINNLWRTKNNKRETLVITGGEKDVMTLVTLGFDAITLNSETALLSTLISDDFLSMYKKVVVLYDIDETGIKSSKLLASKHGFNRCVLPDELKISDGKDVSDYVRLGLSIDQLKQSIRNAKPLIDEIDVSDEEIENEITISKMTISNNCDLQNQEFEEGKDEIIGSPLLPDEVFNLLPAFFSDITKQFTDKRDKDIILLSSLAVMSSLIPMSKGTYGGQTIGCNLNLFITAPASAGKSIMSWSRKLGIKVHKHLKEKYSADQFDYKNKLQKYLSDVKSNPDAKKPEEPKEQRLFIPANSSCSTIYEYLDANQNFGIIFDAEGDTLASTQSADWSNFSVLIRKAFQHEAASMARRTDKEHREIESPHLSTVLSGTRNQIKNLINSVENGLFSRFLFYDFEAEPVWKDMFGDGNNDLEKCFEKLSERVLDFWFVSYRKQVTYYSFDEKQREESFKYFESKFFELRHIFGEDITPSVKRACLMYYRIAIILQTIDNYEKYDYKKCTLPERFAIKDKYYRCAFLIIDTLIEHLQYVFSMMQRTVSLDKLNCKQRVLFDKLPEMFITTEFNETAEENDVTKAAAQKYLRDFVKHKVILRYEHGKYRKV